MVRYLGQYTHRVAISNHRLVAMNEQGVTFRTKTGELVTLDGVSFLDRWLGHILPPRFRKIRHYGLLSPRHATSRLELARQRLPSTTESSIPTVTPPDDPTTSNLHTARWREVIRILTGIDPDACPSCGAHQLERRPLPRHITSARAPPRAA